MTVKARWTPAVVAASSVFLWPVVVLLALSGGSISAQTRMPCTSDSSVNCYSPTVVQVDPITGQAVGSVSVGPITPGPATATGEIQAGCQFNSTLPAWSESNQGAVRCDQHGNLRIVPPGGDTFPFTISGTGVIQPTGIVGTLDTSGYQSVILQITSMPASTIVAATRSSDGSTFTSVGGLPASATGGTACSSSVTSAASYVFPAGKFFQVSVTSYVGPGSITGYLTLSNMPPPPCPALTNVAGAAAHGSSITGGPVRVAGRARVGSNYAAISNDTIADLATSAVGAVATSPYSIPDASWQSTQSVADTSSHAIQAAGATGIRNYITGLQVFGISTTVATTLSVLDGSTVIWQRTLPAGVSDTRVVFETPLRTTAATALNVQLGTTPTGAVAVNAQGFSAP